MQQNITQNETYDMTRSLDAWFPRTHAVYFFSLLFEINDMHCKFMELSDFKDLFVNVYQNRSNEN